MDGMTKEAAGTGQPEFWEDHVRRWKKTGLIQAEYCRRNELKAVAFSYWKRKLKRRDAGPAFVEVVAEPGGKASPRNLFEIRLEEGRGLAVQLRLSLGFVKLPFVLGGDDVSGDV